MAYNSGIMKRVYIEEISRYQGEEVEIRGWVYNKRSSGKVRFLLVRDGTGIIQATIFSPEKDHPLFLQFDQLTQESSVVIRGQIVEEKRAPGGYEMAVKEMETIHIAQD